MELSVDPHRATVGYALMSFAERGFRRIVLWRRSAGCDLGDVIDSFSRGAGGRARAFMPEQRYREEWRRIREPHLAGKYGDRVIAAVALYLRPDVVRAEGTSASEQEPKCGSPPRCWEHS